MSVPGVGVRTTASPPAYTSIDLRVEDGIAHLTLNRPEARNALTLVRGLRELPQPSWRRQRLGRRRGGRVRPRLGPRRHLQGCVLAAAFSEAVAQQVQADGAEFVEGAMAFLQKRRI